MNRVLATASVLLSLSVFAIGAPSASAQEVTGHLSCVADHKTGFLVHGAGLEEPFLIDADDDEGLLDEESAIWEASGETYLCTGLDLTDPENPSPFVSRALAQMRVTYTYTLCGAGHWSGAIEFEGLDWPLAAFNDYSLTATFEADRAGNSIEGQVTDVDGSANGNAIAGGVGSASFRLSDVGIPGVPHCEGDKSVYEFLLDFDINFSFHG